jgi:hypothetical protein
MPCRTMLRRVSYTQPRLTPAGLSLDAAGVDMTWNGQWLFFITAVVIAALYLYLAIA